MPTINLLPWRERIREAQKKQFVSVWIGCVIMSCLLMLMVHGIFSYKIKNQKSTNVTLTNEIRQLDIKIAAVVNIKKERADLLARMKVIQELQQSRPLTVKIVDAMTRLMPDGVYLTNIARKGSQLIIRGKAESNTRVSELMRELEQSPYFSTPQLNEIKTRKDIEIYASEFELLCQQKESSEMNHG